MTVVASTTSTTNYERLLDPVTFEVVRGGFQYIARRMFDSLQAMSFTPIVYEIADFSVCIFDPNGDLIGQNAGCPIHLGAMKHSAAAIIKAFPDMQEGDAAVLNDPYNGGTHTPDVTIVTPMYAEGKLAGYSCARAHWVDMGGGGTGSQAWGTHIASEGFRIPPTLLMEKGVLNETLVRLWQNQVRMPDRVRGDIMAQIGCCRTAEREMQDLVGRLGFDTVVTKGTRDVIDYTEAIFREEIAQLPDGEYEGIDFTESDGCRAADLKVRLRVIIEGDQIIVDFEGTSPLAEGAVNSPLANTHGAVLYSMLGMLAPGLNLNQGLYNAIDIRVPDGCFLNAVWPYPTIGSTTHTATKIATAVWMALDKIVPPTKAIGSTYGECNWYIASVVDPKTGKPNLISDLPCGGWGATGEHDGVDGTNDPHIVSAYQMSAEVGEQAHPCEWQQFELRPDSGGPGKYRGGVGMIFKLTPKDNMYLSMETSRTKIGAPGTQGGGRGAVVYVLRENADGSFDTMMGREYTCSFLEDEDWEAKWQMSLRADMRFPKGSSYIVLSGGGGGWGDPLERDVDAVRYDVEQGFVTVMGAKNDYGVVLDPDTLEVDVAATEKARAALAADPAYRAGLQDARFDHVPLESLIVNRSN